MSDFWAQVTTLARSLERRSYYALLEVTDEATPDEVRAAYARLIGTYHPDRHAREADPDRKRALVSIQARLNEAYRGLIDPTRRVAYDRGLAEGKLRLADGPAAARAPSISLVSPRARTFFDAGQECERAGDLAGARMQYGLAIQVDPEAVPIREAIARLSAPPPPPPPEPAPRPAPPSDFVREDTRHPFARPVKLRCTSWEQVITMHARNLSRGGIFVKTASPLELGTRLDVQLALPDGRTLTLEAEVARVVAPERDGDEPSGMALRFLPMDDERKAAFDEALAEAAAHAGRAAPTTTRPPRAASSDPIEEATLREVRADVARLREARRHEILGVAADANADELHAAFVRLAKRHHPDLFVRYKSPLVVDAAVDAFAIVSQAYEHLRLEALARASAPPAPPPDAGTPARPLLAEDLFSDRVDTRANEPAPAPVDNAAQLAHQGRAALVAGRHAEARELLGQATRLEPRDRLLRAAFHLASGYEAKAAGRAREAIDHFETALVFDKACEEAIRALRAAAASGGKRS